ncbi:MAG: hypothetical protein HY518_02385 [Candidatus Aenigmarchaeota archaeon]|nr:hypothetical protein [Candidatus Aenigmarchaeota archaeon]
MSYPKTTKAIIGVIAGIIIAGQLLSITAAQSDFVSVNVSISSVTEITVSPEAINFSALSPGSNSATQTVTIKNTGSANITTVYVNATTIDNETVNPLGTGRPDLYASTGFIMIQNTTNSSWVHVGRKEWNLTAVLAGETVNQGAGIVNFSHGFYRNSSGNNYLWKVENGTGGFCNSTATTFIIKTNPENATGGLQRDLSTGTVSATATAANAFWTAFAGAGPLQNQCIVTDFNCKFIYIYKYDPTTYPSCTAASNLHNSQIVPGEEAGVTIMASIPDGVPAGKTLIGNIVFTAT